MKLSTIAGILGGLGRLTAAQVGVHACYCYDKTLTTVPDFNITEFAFHWDPTSQEDHYSFTWQFWSGVPSAQCSLVLPAATSDPVGSLVSPSSNCVVPDEPNIQVWFMVNQTWPEQVYTFTLRSHYINNAHICAECTHWGQHNITADQLTRTCNGGRVYSGPTSFSVDAAFWHG
ncbi:hypothetical protein NKR23_g9617 [Pleurostoma richardsiae]|uniref:AA1-like domain-containing protein n=1 Tax=Pleurostoma richardsiae TaxID=41990 RepID=A0AA38VJR7_9PEZI|nr:hypothetical protein NKR23_g9617 [Pleurostoma richardsiae]